MLWLGDGGLWFRSFPGFDVDAGPVAERIYASSRGMEAEAYNGYLYVLGMDAWEVAVIVLDSATGDLISGPSVISDSGYYRGDIVAAPGRDYLGSCYKTWDRSSEDRDLAFRLISSDGVPLGSEYMIDSSPEMRGCAIDWSGNEFLVVYSADDELFAQRIRPPI